MRARESARARCVALAAVLLLGLTVADVAFALTIRGDANWQENPDCPPGWEQPSFDDSDWRYVDFPWLYIWPREWPLDPQARPFWGTERFHENCLRREFVLNEPPRSAATARVWVDDDYEFYVNGQLVGASRDGSATFPGETYAVATGLREGRNVLALRLRDAGGAMGALFSLEIPDHEAPRPTVRDRIRSVAPWLHLVGIAALFGAWIVAVRRTQKHRAPLLGRIPSERIALRALVGALVCQALLQWIPLYTGLRDMPALEWNFVPLFAIATSFGWVVVECAGLSLLPDDGPTPQREGILLALIVLLALAFRTVLLDSIPVGFFQDEATNANDAVALGNLDGWLLWSESVGGRPTLFLYLLHGALRIVGESYLSLKIVPVAIGTATVISLWAFGRVAFGPRVALWAAFLLAAMRWHVHFSRMAWEAICLPFFSVTGFALLLYGLRRERYARSSVLAAAVVLGAGLYTYAAYRAIPAVALAFLAATLLSSQWRIVTARALPLFVGAGLASIVTWPLLRFAREHPDLYWWRYNEVSLTSYMAYFGTPLPWVDQFARSLLSLNGAGDEIIRHNLPGAAHLDPITGMLFLLGLGISVWRWHHSGSRFVLVWFFGFALLASLTRDGPHATRLLGLAPACALLAAVAIEKIADALAPRWNRVRLSLAGALLAGAIAASNGYQYFGLEARHPEADALLNTTGRRVCEYLRREEGLAVYFSDDIAFWAEGQCYFLARNRNDPPKTIHVEDVVLGNPLRRSDRETVVFLGREFLDRHSTEAPDEPIDLPGKPVEEFDRQGQLLFRLYRFGGGDAGREPRIDRSVSSTTGSSAISANVRPIRRRQLG